MLDAILYNKRYDVQEAAYAMLQEWLKRQPSCTEAYRKLWEALTHPDVNLSEIAHAVLGDMPGSHPLPPDKGITDINNHLM